MIISVDTVKDAPADLRAAAALILSLAAERDGSSGAQSHPFPPLHENHPHERDVREHVAAQPPREEPVDRPVRFVPKPAEATPSRRIADLLAEVGQEKSDDDEPPKRVIPKESVPEDKPIIRRIPPGVQVY